MQALRHRLHAGAVMLLLWQCAALVAAPLALGGGLSAFGVAAVELDECCKNLAPGQTCPMHHHTAGESTAKPSGPAWNCSCPTQSAALTTLVSVGGALLPLQGTDTAAHSSPFQSVRSDAVRSRPSPPFRRPPRPRSPLAFQTI